jgi:hypothetical protein
MNSGVAGRVSTSRRMAGRVSMSSGVAGRVSRRVRRLFVAIRVSEHISRRKGKNCRSAERSVDVLIGWLVA